MLNNNILSCAFFSILHSGGMGHQHGTTNLLVNLHGMTGSQLVNPRGTTIIRLASLRGIIQLASLYGTIIQLVNLHGIIRLVSLQNQHAIQHANQLVNQHAIQLVNQPTSLHGTINQLAVEAEDPIIMVMTGTESTLERAIQSDGLPMDGILISGGVMS